MDLKHERREAVKLTIEALAAKPDGIAGKSTGTEFATELVKAAEIIGEYITSGTNATGAQP